MTNRVTVAETSYLVELGVRVRHRRKVLRLSRKSVATICGVHAQCLSVAPAVVCESERRVVTVSAEPASPSVLAMTSAPVALEERTSLVPKPPTGLR